ncbi:hypothetical protein [Streptomyces sp. NBC_01304]|uniref:hypothetical protein n=1 Tax=Streptomyces sp. NBC_01304 TaxID=2903818 RepID=UPI002E0EBFF7|nr:hypothetical protein OG430_22745 [Streptomyces sp. NBC_01304]
MPKLPKLREKKALWGVSAAAVLVLGGGGFVVYESEIADDDEVCCALPPPLYGVPRGPDGEIDVASQSVETKVPVDHDFSLHLRPGGKAEWELAETGESGNVLRAKGVKTVKGTRYFKFRALKTGTARVVLREVDGDRTMTYPIEVKESIGGTSVAEDPEEYYPEADDPLKFRKLDRDFDGTVTVRRGEEFRVANSYDNQPGYTWKIAEKPDDTVVGLYPDANPRVGGSPAADRKDWYGFTARAKGTTTVKLFGCYRCGYDSEPTSAESKKFSLTKTLTVVVR